jgi:hypothetical protein
VFEKVGWSRVSMHGVIAFFRPISCFLLLCAEQRLCVVFLHVGIASLIVVEGDDDDESWLCCAPVVKCMCSIER